MSQGMNQAAFVQLLVTADTLDAANRLISGLRSAGVPVRSASTADARELGNLLARGPWDVLVSYASERLPPTAVLAALTQAEVDLPVLCVGAAPVTPTANLRESVGADANEHLLAAVRREAEISQLKRRLRQLELQQRELEDRGQLHR